ncbi:alpha-tectorin-like [Sinocyclocheilus rhinocerous]|uniref:alpha-tectorin-like n=1 Tax=Sinocyclocheilus rhinocerous TaxID=307959 RepID=UPI0007BA8EC5|nr:PREDICTED: alpha-tectorin-like [Sinocyclocheilus rhinocerous]
MCDAYVSWMGWYRLFIHGQSVQMPDTCVDRLSCGTHAPLWLNGPHPRIEDGVVTRDVCGHWWNNCCGFQSNPIRVKACPDNYYVYEFVSPSFCYGTYCADVRNNSISIPTFTPETTLAEAFRIDPCYNYTALDDPWRATDNHNSYNCDASVNWDGWYRLFIAGQDAQMPETCVNQFSCGTVAPLWLNGQHPRVEDGVVTRHVCGHWNNDCCNYVFNPMKVKACPGNYYVYEFMNPVFCSVAYCSVTTPSSDPCFDYNILDDDWRDLRQNSQSYDHDDTAVEWNGWYRLYLNGESAQLSEWCVTLARCGGEVGLYLNASHPQLEDGVVTREVLGSSSWWWNSNQCGYFRSTSIQVKACPGDYYVYKLDKPDVSIPRPTYCAVAFNSISNDPCYNYESLDRPWRATDETGFYICDESFSWNGWYRLFYNGANIRMPESCVNAGSCNTQYSLSLAGPHPQVEDGVVTMEVCTRTWTWYSSYDLKQTPIRVKACPGDYYVYELVNQPAYGCSGYCTDVSTISLVSTTSPATSPGFSMTLNYDPCYNYNILDNYWRSTLWYMSGYDDTRVEWHGWYRFFINGSSAQMPEWCFSYMSCGGFISLWLGGPHPQPEDGVVTREIYGSVNDQCSSYTSNPIQVKACPGNVYVYRLLRPKPSIPVPVYCAVLFNTPNTDPCYDYTSLDDPWRATDNYYNNYMCDYNVNWNGWYRLFYYGQSVQMPESSVGSDMCGTPHPLWLNGPHPQLEDGVVTRQVCGSTWNDGCGYKSHPIQVKACPGNYYVYEFVRPTFCASYCADVTNLASTTTSETTVTIPPTESSTLSVTTPAEAIPFDPCYNYTVLDDSWRSISNQHSSFIMCDAHVNWNGWYRLFIGGQSGQMPDTCVDQYRCSTHAPLWLNGQHPQVEDGVVTRNICGHWGNDCCYFQSNPIKVKACPGNYYVYEFVQPNFCSGTYCAAPTPSSDPCSGYNVLDDGWRDLRTNFYQSYYNDDRFVEWNGWYRLYLNGESAQLSEWCASFTGCGGEVGLYLNGSHPKPEDGVVTREVLGSSSWAWWWWWWNAHHCGYYKSTSIEIKACPGDYYVYKLVKPDMSIPTPTYCAVAFNNISNDPCYNYENLDRPWRATNETGLYICDENFSWNGWYRLFYNGMDIRMQESCVADGSCNTYSSLWLNGPHPQIEDGVVTMEVCGGRYYSCCDFKSTPIRVKACPGNYYVYELVKPHSFYCSGYCTDASTISTTFSSTSPATFMGSSMTAINTDFDPCYDNNILDNSWRSTLNLWYQYAHDDTLVEWHGWYRLFIDGSSAQMPEWCFSYMLCGGYSSLWLGGPHPEIEDGVVTREVYGSVNDQCSYYRSDPIQVKACPGSYYVYKIKRPKVLIPAPTYCAVAFTTPSADPCYNYNSLDEPQRATISPHYDKYYYYGICDYNVNWNGWYRLFYYGQSVQMPDSCVGYGMCGTPSPLWLNSPHPQLEDGVVTRQVCVSTWNDCCGHKSHPIRVKACPGNYYVYEFVRPPFCSAYCAEVNVTHTTTRSNISSGPFYPFGAGDTENDRSDDGISPVISLLQPFRFFGQTYNQLYINNNGYLTFDWPWYSYFPYQFPGYGGEDLIAPFWTDIDNRGNGFISYRQYSSGSVLAEATQDINQYFPDLSFSATWVFVATWDRVAYYPYSGTETSFQVVLISDGHFSFVLFNYGTIAPTQRYVQAGYDTISSTYHFSITGSLQYNITSLTYSSNVNVPGRWVFRTDHGSRGCQFNGIPVQLEDSFWSDATCQQRCTCTSSGLQCSHEPCTYSQACRPAAFQYSCQNIQRQTCTISGDPHYYTFDYQVFHFQGTCTYVLSEACGNGLPYYRIEGKNEHRGSTHVSWTRMVRVFVYDEVIELVKDHYYEARVSGSFAATPFTLRNGSIQVYQSGFTLAISTDFGLLVTYDAYSYVSISVPYDYFNFTCGLCGNFNLHPEDDFRSPSGEILSSDVDFANSWKVQSDTDPECHNVRCTGLACAVCTTDEMTLYSDSSHCGILEDVVGPFVDCHPVHAPQTYIENCVYDLCLGGGYQPILCQALNVYATQCQQQGVHLGQWRQQGFCEIQCPVHSHFEPQGTGCPVTCSNPSAPMNCPLPSQESCICDPGYILSAGECVPEANCGCIFEGFYYVEGQSVVLDGDCGRQCVCSSMSMTCHEHQCGPAEVCGVHDGVRGCRPTGYATCSVEDLGSYHTFDGQSFRYSGACGLTLTRVMGPSPLPHFVLTVEKVPRGLQDFSRVLKFEAEGIQVTIEMGEGSNVKVDGQMVGLPVSVGSGQIRIYHSSVRGFVLETNFGVTVRADWPHIVRITAPSTYSGTLGGLCGNLNGDIADEFYTPDAVLLNDTQLFADSWRDGSLSAHCEDPNDSWETGHYQNSSQFIEHCSIMAKHDGPFAECSRATDPQQRIADCVQLLEQTQGAREALCEALRGYTLLCQQNGIAVEEWRIATHCDPSCPANSHYVVCGTSCPASCPSLSFPFQCTLQCQEGCQCNDGNVLNGDRCVPPVGCGCYHSGRYRQAGETFWHGEECQFLCVCDGITGNVHCTPSSCSEVEVCHVLDGEYGCHPRPHARCSASGDPHYMSFDKSYFDFQGTCRYVLATVCNDTTGLPHFQVDARNEAWHGLPVSITVEIFVNVSGHLVHMSRDMNRWFTVEVDGETRNLPILLDSGRVSVYSSAQYIFVSTDFGLSVGYSGSWAVDIIVPADYGGVTCGICGNFNGQSNDDFMTPSGALVRSADQFGASWKVEDELPCNDGCGNNCPLCQDQTTSRSLCDIIRSSEGPFSFCHVYADPQAYFDDCVFDVCLSGNRNDVLCRSIQTYASACQSNNAVIYPWRESASCVITCPENSHYELCGTDCGHTCASNIDASCEHTCSEGCFCDDGLVRSGGLCASVEQCGCLHTGFYFNVGEQFWNEECSQLCECFAPNDLRCSDSTCPSTMECTVRNGLRGCYEDSTTHMTTTKSSIHSDESTTHIITTTSSLPSEESTTYMTTTRSTIPSSEGDPCLELSCTENEQCEEKHGVYGCSCKENHHRSQHDSFDFIETCESSSGSMSLSRCQLFEAGFPSDILHLNDPNCRGTVRNGRVEFYFDNNDHICGTNLVANGTHFIYKNFIVGEPKLVGHLISRKRILKLPFSCVYSQTQILSMDINPLESTVHMNLPAGQGTYQVRMIPYQDAEFSHPFAGSVNAELSKRIFVDVGVDGVDSRQFASVIDTCWATPVNDPHYPLRWDLIVDGCPNPNDDTVELLQNGVSTSSRFSFEMFIFTADSTKVYLHCAVHLCLLTDNHCSVHCDSEHHHRAGRSVDFHDSTSISLGPLMWSDGNKDTPMPRQVLVSRAPCLLGSLTISLISLMSLLIFC